MDEKGGHKPSEVQKTLLKPDIIFENAENLLKKTDSSESIFIAQKLNAFFHDRILHEIIAIVGKRDEDAFFQVLEESTRSLDFRNFLNSKLADAVGAAVLQAKPKASDKTAEHVSRIEQALKKSSLPDGAINISDLLHLKPPIRENPVLFDVMLAAREAMVLQTAKLDDNIAQKLQKDKKISSLLDLDTSHREELSQAVKEGILNEKQKDDLLLAISLVKLTGENLSLIQAITSKGVTNISELAWWEKDKWIQFLTNEKAPLPPGETIESYAEHMIYNIEKAYPSQALFARISTAGKGALAKIDSLLEYSDSHVENGDGRDAKSSSGNNSGPKIAGDQDRKSATSDKSSIEVTKEELLVFAKTYKRLGVMDILQDKNMKLSEKRSVISTRVGLLETFFKNNPELDLRFVNLVEKTSPLNKESAPGSNAGSLEINWEKIPEDQRSFIKRQLMACQRVLLLTDEADIQHLLLQKGFDSALKIAGNTAEAFAKETGLSPDTASVIYSFAAEKAVMLADDLETVHDATSPNNFRSLQVANIDSTVINDLHRVDGLSELFGSQDYCACEECRSILSPAAYFADLMKFIQTNISSVSFGQSMTDHPLHLHNRRPDLWDLPLTCENTQNLVPYLTIVNDVLETYLYNNLVARHRSGSGRQGRNEIRNLLYEILSNNNSRDNNFSFALPFNLPLEELRLYLSHFNLSLFELSKALREDEEKIWRQKLNMSPAEMRVVLYPNPNGTYIKLRFGNPSNFDDFPVKDFLQLAGGITRKQLDELLSMQYLPSLRDITIRKDRDGQDTDDIINYKEKIRGLDNQRADLIHRFIRLWKKTPWTISEFDQILLAMLGAHLVRQNFDLSNSTGPSLEPGIRSIAKLIDCQERLSLSVEELCAIIHLIPSSTLSANPVRQSETRLFERLFNVSGLFDNQSRFFFYHPHFNNDSQSRSHVADNRMPLLLEGLSISESDFLTLLSFLDDRLPIASDQRPVDGSHPPERLLGFNEQGRCELDLQKISLIYRHVRIARALKLSIKDFISLLYLLFPSMPHPVVSTINQIQSLMEFLGRFDDFNSLFLPNRLDIGWMNFVISGKESEGNKYSTNSSSVQRIINHIRGRPAGQTSLADSLKEALRESFNVSSDQLTNILEWTKTDMSGTQFSSVLTRINNNFDVVRPIEELRKQIERIRALVGKLNLEEADFGFITRWHSAIFGINNRRAITLEGLQSIATYSKLLKIAKTNNSGSDPAAVRTMLEALVIPDGLSSFLAVAARLLKVEQSFVASVLELMPDRRSVSIIQLADRLLDYSKICNTLGINGPSLKKLLSVDSDFNAVLQARDVALAAFTSKYPDEKLRREKLEPFQERINTMKRDVLCAYIIARRETWKFRDLHDIYAFFLLDPEMGGCFRISKIVCAISSLQLYVHRCLVGLERSEPLLNNTIPDIEVRPNSSVKEQWEWRKNYRLWEANRKVFLFPENYLEPSLRDNKTPLFKELEDELLQEKVTMESAEAAYKKYLSQFVELAGLKIVGSYCHIHGSENGSGHKCSDAKTYYFFGCTRQDPARFFYRKLNVSSNGNREWRPWEKMDLQINSGMVSAIVYQGKLYVFWLEIKSSPDTRTSGGSSTTNYKYARELAYSFLDENRKWAPVQKITFTESSDLSNRFFGGFMPNIEPFLSRIVYPSVRNNQLYVSGPDFLEPDIRTLRLNLSRNAAVVDREGNADHEISAGSELLSFALEYVAAGDRENVAGLLNWALRSWSPKPTPPVQSSDAVELSLSKHISPTSIHESSLAFPIVIPRIGRTILTNRFKLSAELEYGLFPIGQTNGMDYILKAGDQYFLLAKVGRNVSTSLGRRASYRISTSLADTLGETLHSQDLEAFLSLDNQQRTERSLEIRFENESELSAPVDNPNHIDFTGAYGEYYRELFFHIPFLIASHLNANQKFKEAKWWYERIFDPAGTPPVRNGQSRQDRNWQYVEFRNLTSRRLMEKLTDGSSIEKYKRDPFNPHAIARRRLTAYQKTIVMKYIDNLLDWGDFLFAQDTIESINEATMLYILASDILGKRPAKLGKCEMAAEGQITYGRIRPAMEEGGAEFLVPFENWQWITSLVGTANSFSGSNSGQVSGKNSEVAEEDSGSVRNDERKILEKMSMTSKVVHLFDDVKRQKSADKESKGQVSKRPVHFLQPSILFIVPPDTGQLVFCLPNNEHLLGYWDRVEDRLFKIRNCLNMSGVRRHLPLFQLPLDVMNIVRNAAPGLSLEDINSQATNPPPLPPYRFTFLLEKAKQFAQLVQGFGNSLLNALEKKDAEQLILLRSVHEREILSMTREIKRRQIEEAERQLNAARESTVNVQNRINYYDGLIKGDLIPWEVTEQVSKHLATTLQTADTILRALGASFYLVPQVGSPFSLNYGGKQLGDTTISLADFQSSLVKTLEMVSSSAALVASFERRKQEWNHQLELARQELRQATEQQLAAQIRHLIAQKDLEVHEKNVEQANELYDFYKDKFTKLGLYNYLSTSLGRLHREAYLLAGRLAKMAEQAYRFEHGIDDETAPRFISDANWQVENAGLLAGESLLLQLGQLEKQHIEQDKRDFEITQSFSLVLLSPQSLIDLRAKGVCKFIIPEALFDLYYPGHYRRLIKSVRITIPCIAGPYTNIGAQLSLKSSKIRTVDANGNDVIRVTPPGRPVTDSISTSSAQGDSGTFELNFRDERYLPFEGAGAVESEWDLELPTAFRAFDYGTISDVILHISYTALDGKPTFKTRVAQRLSTMIQDYAREAGLFRLVSLKHEFPVAWHKLLNPSSTAPQGTEFELTQAHFPSFLFQKDNGNVELSFSTATQTIHPIEVYLKPKANESLETENLVLNVNGAEIERWETFQKMKKATLTPQNPSPEVPIPESSVRGSPIREWSISVASGAIDKDKIDDMLVLVRYTVGYRG